MICAVCGEEIGDAEKFMYAKDKPYKNIWVHKTCVKRKRATMIIQKGLKARGARELAEKHNLKYHRGIPRAHIRIDPSCLSKEDILYYEVYCTECIAEDIDVGD